jgi:hypothetical protein
MTFLLKTTEIIVAIGEYFNGRPAIQLFDAEDGSPYGVASTNIDEIRLEDGEILIKDYAENEGLLAFLLKNNIVKDTGKIACHEYCVFNICSLNPQHVWGTKKSYIFEDQLN